MLLYMIKAIFEIFLMKMVWVMNFIHLQILQYKFGNVILLPYNILKIVENPIST